MEPRSRFAVTASPVLRVGCGCTGAVLLYLLASVVVIPIFSMAAGEKQDPVFLLMLMPLAGGLVVLVIGGFRLLVRGMTAWIDHGTLVRRTLVGTRRIDLAWADVQVNRAPAASAVPELVVRDSQRTEIRIPLKHAMGWISPRHLHTLADALAASSERHTAVARMLRELADDPRRRLD
ncbi:MAG: hypothetical protein HOY71_47240 [Nonomuraea sp.]|nr:hypothetical protein [Nonomuraea sp.]